FIEDRCVSMKQWSVDHIRMAHNPTNVRSCPVDVAGVDTIDVLHGPLQGHKMTAVIANNSFRLPGGARGIENVEGMRCGHRNALVWLRRLHDFIPVAVAACREFGALHLALKDDAALRFVPGD